jgi:hypothetical protein
MINEDDCEAIGGIKIGRGNRSTRRNLPQRHFVHHKSHMTRPGLEPRAAAMGSQRLTAWAMARPCALCKELDLLNKFNIRIFHPYRGRYCKSISGSLVAQVACRKPCKVSHSLFVLGCVKMIMSFSLFGLRNKFEVASTLARLNRIIWRNMTNINLQCLCSDVGCDLLN